jgi:hypothetical protein
MSPSGHSWRFRSSSKLAQTPAIFRRANQAVALEPAGGGAVDPVPSPGSAMNILDPQGPIGAADKTILIDSIAIILAIVTTT